MPFTTRFWGSTAVVLCALLVQSCQPHSVSATAEEELAASPSSSASAVHQRALGEPPAVQFLALLKEDHATLPSARALIPSASSTLASASNPSEAPHNPPATERLGAHALYNAPGDVFPSVFTASSGERVRFRQHDGQWRAVLAPGTSLNAQEHTLPVVSSGDIGALLSSLQGQDAWSSRSRIHVLATPTTPYSPCVYVGKVGLLGGAPSDRVVEWKSGPHIRLSKSNDTRTEAYHIPLGYRYLEYRERPGSVVQRASCTIRYVEANSAEEINMLVQYKDERSLEAYLSANFANVMNLGTLGGGVRGGQSHGYHSSQAARFTHAALVVYASTGQNRVCKKKSKVDVQLEIGIERIDEDAPSPPRREAEREKQAEEDRKKEEELKKREERLAESLRKEEERKEEERKAALQKQAEEDRKKEAAALQKQAELSQAVIPTMAFGASSWQQYYGEVGEEPALPADMETTLDAPCPFWESEGKKVRDTHLLVLIPAEIDGKPFTLNLLGELIKSPKGRGNKTKYRYCASTVQSQVGNEAPAGSYWVLLTRDVLPESRNKTYAAQKEIVAGHTSRTGLSYELPKTLEAATAILTHHVRTGGRLYSDAPLTYTRCQELIRYDSDDYPSVVGGFDSSGLDVDVNDVNNFSFHYIYGVAGCRKFF